MESCTCGNVLREINVRITVSPCRCEVPGPGKSIKNIHGFINFDEVSRKQFDQRTRLGLEIETPAEKTAAERHY